MVQFELELLLCYTMITKLHLIFTSVPGCNSAFKVIPVCQLALVKLSYGTKDTVLLVIFPVAIFLPFKS